MVTIPARDSLPSFSDLKKKKKKGKPEALEIQGDFFVAYLDFQFHIRKIIPGKKTRHGWFLMFISQIQRVL